MTVGEAVRGPREGRRDWEGAEVAEGRGGVVMGRDWSACWSRQASRSRACCGGA
jgi:hypothetical protein